MGYLLANIYSPKIGVVTIFLYKTLIPTLIRNFEPLLKKTSQGGGI